MGSFPVNGGTSDADDGWKLRQADDRARDERSRVPLPPTRGASTILCQTVSGGSYPTTAGVYYKVQPYAPLGTETEGSAGSYTSEGGAFYALNIGTAVPAAGSKVAVTQCGYRHCFQWNG